MPSVVVDLREAALVRSPDGPGALAALPAAAGKRPSGRGAPARRLAGRASDLEKNGTAGLLDWAGRWTRAEPGNATAWFALGRAYSKLRRYPEAIEAYRRDLAIEPATSMPEQSRQCLPRQQSVP